ncbi:hypothetical protein [Bacteroidetes bacterium endosymbiont of Geopemphigus sp.]|nr:hypothetical protein [Bacteroidetes bacterium endosymbiont of Geopemphigus sp.]
MFLLKHFKSAKVVKETSGEALEKLIGAHRATMLQAYFQEQTSS